MMWFLINRPKRRASWTIVLNLDTSYPFNSPTSVRVVGFLMSPTAPIAPWLPQGTQ